MRYRVAVVALALGAAVACDSGPQAGEITLDLVTPNQNDGAIQFTVMSGANEILAAVAAACAGCQVYSQTVSETEIRGVVVGTIGAGALLRVTVSDVKAKMYEGAVVAVAASDYSLRAASAYSLARSD